MSDLFTIDHAYPERKRAQLRQVAEIIGIDEAYLFRMLDFFVARICADRRLGRFCADQIGSDRTRHLDRMMAFWRMIALNTDGYAGDFVAMHRNLDGIRREDFGRWLELFRATIDETAPTREAANYLMVRVTRVAQSLEMAIFERTADDVPILRAKRPADGRS